MESLLQVITWSFLLIILYTYLGYPILLGLMVKLRPRTWESPPSYLPTIAHIIPAYNEEKWLNEKIRNSLSLSYPKDKYRIIVVTDGSTDRSAAIVNTFTDVLHVHYPERRGKTGAINRALPLIHEEIVVVSDANSYLNDSALHHLVRPFNEEDVGVVAGEKRILPRETEKASGAGEGLYWKYESLLKKWDGELYSVVGAAGELFAFRKNLLSSMDESIILEDFYISLDLASKGFRTAYAPDAIASEAASANINAELKRKVRIAAGGFQAMWRLRKLLNVFKYGILSFQYISHRVLRWTLAPLGLVIVFIGSMLLAFKGLTSFQVLFTLNLVFYVFGAIGAIYRNQHVTNKAFFVPFYFLLMNYAVFRGFLRFVRGKQSSIWEKSRTS